MLQVSSSSSSSPVFSPVDYKTVAIMPDGKAGVPSIASGKLYQYVLAGNGVFIHATRPGLQACVQVAEAEIKGLPPLQAFCHFLYPKVPYGALVEMHKRAQAAKTPAGNYLEILFHLISNLQDNKWQLRTPPQHQTPGSCQPVEGSAGVGSSYDLALVELHSHHRMQAYFSGTDDADERGFRVYAVMGEIDNPLVPISVRVGVYGHFLNIPASSVFHMTDAQTGSGKFICQLERSKLQAKIMTDIHLRLAGMPPKLNRRVFTTNEASGPIKVVGASTTKANDEVEVEGW
jgi:PRTRC genetic system protein A